MGPLEDISSESLLRAGPVQLRSLRTLVKFWTSPRVEIPQLPWVPFPNVWQLLRWNLFPSFGDLLCCSLSPLPLLFLFAVIQEIWIKRNYEDVAAQSPVAALEISARTKYWPCCWWQMFINPPVVYITTLMIFLTTSVTVPSTMFQLDGFKIVTKKSGPSGWQT